jgi:hypothetical protein
LRLLRSTQQPQTEAAGRSLFSKEAARTERIVQPSYVNDETKYRSAFEAASEGKAQNKISQVSDHLPLAFGCAILLLLIVSKAIDIFCDFQAKAENLFRAARP